MMVHVRREEGRRPHEAIPYHYVQDCRCRRGTHHLKCSATESTATTQAKMKMGRIMQLAAFSLAEVTYATGDISYLVQEAATQATLQVTSKQENVSGVMLPAFEVVRKKGEGSGNDFTLTGLGRGGQQVQKCRETYAKAVETLVELASLQVRPLYTF